MCYFLNGKADINSNKYLKGFNPLILSKVEMYEYIKFKTDNFDKIKFQLVFDEIVSYCFEYMDFYRRAFVDGKVINKWVTDYEVDYNFTDKQPYEYICRTLELNKGLIVNCQQIVEFVKMAEDLYLNNNATSAPDTATKKTQPMKLTTELNQVRMKAIHQWLTGNSYIKVDIESWLYWFDLQTWINKKKNPSKIKWIGAVYHLTNVVYLLCGNMNKQTETAMKNIFQIPEGREFQKVTEKNIQKDVEPYKSMDSMMNYAERFIKDK